MAFMGIGAGSLGAGELPIYTVERRCEEIVVDGILDDPDWAAAKSLGELEFPWSEPGESTEVKMLWDDEFLYVSFFCQDSFIAASHYNTNSSTYKDDCVEMFWNPAPQKDDWYYIFEINCFGIPLSVYENHERSIYVRESRVLVPHIAQSIQGTVNDPTDRDTSWVIEMAIRFRDYQELTDTPIPKSGDMWRVALNRRNRVRGREDQTRSMWSPVEPPIRTFHSYEHFGRVYFCDTPVNSN